jgi:NADPH-dependent 2,4-dienoyl-CoA reductase/sulfur reductase-like enzyme
MARPPADPYAINGKFPPPDVSVDVLVVGGGEAGGAAALEAARAGASVLLVDENPVTARSMGDDVPLYFGGRMSGAVQNPGRMLEQVFAASPWLEAAAEAGAEIALSTTCWGAFVNGPALQALPAPVAGLADAERSWMCGFKSLVLATGARDLAYAFPGWDQPGVIGAGALATLLTRYDAFAGRRIVILGSGDLALATALLALDRGLDVAGLVEVRDASQGSPALVEALRVRGTPIFTGCTVAGVDGGPGGVEAVTLAPVTGDGAPQTLACDTLCVAIGQVPAVELLGVLGGRLAPVSARGGWTPVLEGQAVAGLANVFVAGDCAGLGGGDPAAQGRASARAALGLAAEAPASRSAPDFDHHAYRLAWFDALRGDDDVIVCQCEGVTRADLIGVEAPAYVPRPGGGHPHSLRDIAGDRAANPDQVKRLTRAGMGVCQGRRCREQVAMTLARAAGSDLAEVPLATYRAPVRPLPLKVLAAWDEGPAMAGNWDVWYGGSGQWVPYRDIGTPREALHANLLADETSS